MKFKYATCPTDRVKRKARSRRPGYDTTIPWRENFISQYRFVTACTKLSVIYEPVQLPGMGPSALKIHTDTEIDGRAVALIIIINHHGQRAPRRPGQLPLSAPNFSYFMDSIKRAIDMFLRARWMLGKFSSIIEIR